MKILLVSRVPVCFADGNFKEPARNRVIELCERWGKLPVPRAEIETCERAQPRP